MNMPPPDRRSLLALTLAAGLSDRFISDDIGCVRIADLQTGAAVQSMDALRGRAVMLATERQRATILSAIALDGIASRILLCTPDLAVHFPAIVATAQVYAVVTDRREEADAGTVPGASVIRTSSTLDHNNGQMPDRTIKTEWVLFTSGTTGQPKMAIHTLSSLTGPLEDGLAVVPGTVWSTFYDIRRYGGLQIALRALLGGGSLVLSSPEETTGAFLTRLASSGVTHISGTPSHWRKAIMSPAATAIHPKYVRLSGEIADQAILDRLTQFYPTSRVAHAFASTEAGVAFDVQDGKAGFPAVWIDNPNTKAALRVIDGTLHIRSSRTASGYIGRPLTTSDGFVDTGDLVAKEGDRYYFKGRREGVINVGGQKVFPEEVETVLRLHPAIRIARVRARKSPITGAIVVADVVLADPQAALTTIKADLIEHCRRCLPAWKVPGVIHQVDTIDLNAAGKVARVA
jgi:acyl-CoA synthetase (AMP-forming)/AMP-acid ligase II